MQVSGNAYARGSEKLRLSQIRKYFQALFLGGFLGGILGRCPGCRCAGAKRSTGASTLWYRLISNDSRSGQNDQTSNEVLLEWQDKVRSTGADFPRDDSD